MKDSSIYISDHLNQKTFTDLRKIIDLNFYQEEKYYLSMSIEDYRNLMVKAQDSLNENNAALMICKSIEPDIVNYLKTDKFLIQSNVYLRASRPINNPSTENIGWHRETFYGSNMEKSVNIWTPLRGLTLENTLRYIPMSHLIKDEEIKVKKISSDTTKRFSLGHKLGFQYAPKKIIGGVKLNRSLPMMVDYGKSAIFSGNLIHGAAVNSADSIRFSIDFRIIKKSDYSSKNKQHHFSSSKPYFIEY